MNSAIILGGGVGMRMGKSTPKQYLKVNGKSIILYSIEKFLKHPQIDQIIICIAEEWRIFVEKEIQKFHSNTIKTLWSCPGKSRQETIFNALQLLKEKGAVENDIIVIHDAVRPLVTPKIISDCIEGCSKAVGILPVVPVKDTIYHSKNGEEITSLLCRDELFAGQAPEAFRYGPYYEIHKGLSSDQLGAIRGSAEIAYQYGLPIHLIKGDTLNFKITTPEDLSNFEKIIENES